MADDRFEAKIRQIEALLKLASHDSTPQAERELAQAKAEALMFQNRIDRAMLFKADGNGQVREVIIREYPRAVAEEFIGTANHMRANIFIHMGCMVHARLIKTTVVGYEEDIQMAEMLWAQVLLHFTRTVFPRWERHRTFDANVYELKTAGYSWPYVCDRGLENGAGDQFGALTRKNSASKLRSAYKRECSRRGVKPTSQPVNFKKWRSSFAEAYASRLGHRLYEMKAKNEAEAGEAGVLALMSEQDRIKQRFYALFPELNPEVQRRRSQEAFEAEEARRAALTPEEREKEDREEMRLQAKWARESKRRGPYYDEAGWTAGVRAADRADLGQETISAGLRAGRELE